MSDPQIIQVAGRPVSYYEAGEPYRRTLFLLHGQFGDAKLHWSPMMEMLSDEFYLIAPDLPGYGGSALIADMNLSGLVKWVDALMDALGLDQAAVVGHAFGALIARFWAVANPQKIPALVLVNGGVIPSVPGLVKTLAGVPGVGGVLFNQVSRSTLKPDNLRRAIHVKTVLEGDFVERVKANQSGLSRLMQALSRSEIPEKRKPLIPLLILWGEEDTISPPAVGKSVQANIPGAKLHEIAECGHMPQLEVPDVLTWQIKSFLDELDKGRQSR